MVAVFRYIHFCECFFRFGNKTDTFSKKAAEDLAEAFLETNRISTIEPFCENSYEWKTNVALQGYEEVFLEIRVKSFEDKL